MVLWDSQKQIHNYKLPLQYSEVVKSFGCGSEDLEFKAPHGQLTGKPASCNTQKQSTQQSNMTSLKHLTHVKPAQQPRCLGTLTNRSIRTSRLRAYACGSQGLEFAHRFSEWIARLLRKNDHIMSDLSDSLKKWMYNLLKKMSNSLIFGERPERFAHIAH